MLFRYCTRYDIRYNLRIKPACGNIRIKYGCIEQLFTVDTTMVKIRSDINSKLIEHSRDDKLKQSFSQISLDTFG